MSPGSARTIALAQCFKPITYKIDQHRNEPWQVLALWPLLNTEANKSKLYYVLSICSSPRLDIPFYKNPKSTIRWTNQLQLPTWWWAILKTKPPVSVGMCRCQLSANIREKKKTTWNEQLRHNMTILKLTGGVSRTYNPIQQLLSDAKQLHS